MAEQNPMRALVLVGTLLTAAGVAGLWMGWQRVGLVADIAGVDEIPYREWVTENYDTEDPATQNYDVYRPALASGAPMVIIVHGGAEDEGGDKLRMRGRAEWYAGQGMVVVTPNYRYGNAIEDVACAINTAKANAARYGADPSAVIVHGFSFGGYLSSMVVYGGNDNTDKLTSCPAEGKPWEVLGFIGESTQFGNPDGSATNPYADIVAADRVGAWSFVDEHDHVPALLLHGTDDPKFNDQRATDFANRLKQFGVTSTVKIYEGYGHGARLTESPRTQADVLQFLKSLGE